MVLSTTSAIRDRGARGGRDLHHLSGGRFANRHQGGWFQPSTARPGIAFDRPRWASTGSRSRSPSSGDSGEGQPVHHLAPWYQIDGLDLDDAAWAPRPPAPADRRTAAPHAQVAARHADIIRLLPAPDPGAPTTATTRSTGCRPLWRASSRCCARRPVTEFGQAGASARSARSASPTGGGPPPRLIARRGWGGIDAGDVWRIISHVHQRRRPDPRGSQARQGAVRPVVPDQRTASCPRCRGGHHRRMTQ